MFQKEVIRHFSLQFGEEGGSRGMARSRQHDAGSINRNTTRSRRVLSVEESRKLTSSGSDVTGIHDSTLSKTSGLVGSTPFLGFLVTS